MPRAALLTALVLATLLAGCESGDRTANSASDAPRFVTLAPHLAEILFAVGAGSQLVGVSAYSDYPAEVTELPLVGDAFTVDQEQLALLNPDILLAWESGMPASTIDDLRSAGYRVEVIRTRGLDDIETAMRHIGELAGTASTAVSVADSFRAELDALAAEHAGKTELSVFFQIAERPLYTVNGDHFISEVLRVCGGRNVFDDLDTLAPSVDVEAVVARDPDVLVTAGSQTSLDAWRAFDGMAAVRNNRFVALPSDETGRAGPRVIDAARAACKALDAFRADNAE
ncbi:MAG: cobalamin-binding protein [Pseudomonadota bacterium]